MERTEILQKIQQGLDKMKKSGINLFQRDAEQMNRLNPAFGFRATDNKSNLSRARGVMSVWMSGGANDLTVHTLPRGYSGDDKDYKTREMTDNQLKAILDMVDGLNRREINARKQYAANPKVGEIVPNIRAWAEKCARASGPQYSAFVSWGKRAYDRERYHAIVICEKNDQIASISLRQQPSGQITYNLRTPLGGEWTNDETLHVKNMFAQIRECFNDVTNSTLTLDDTLDREKLIQDIQKRNTEWKEKGITLPIKAVQDGAEKEQTWRLFFVHMLNKDNSITLSLNALEGENVKELAKGTFNDFTFEKKDRLLLMGTGDSVDFLETLFNKEMVEIDETHDYSQNDRWMVVDAKDMYDDYMRKMNQKHFDSLLSDIKVVGGPDKGYTLKATLAGVMDCSAAIKPALAEWKNRIADEPLFAFMEQNTAAELFADRLAWFRDMQQRITDVQVSRTASTDYIRCKIDGVQQMRQPITPEQFRSYDRSTNQPATLIALAAKCYADQLSIQQDWGLKR